jgi:hypothetical protein
VSPQDPPEQPAQDRPHLRAVPKRRGRPPKTYPAPPPIAPIPDADGLHARVEPATDHSLSVTWVPATVKPGYSVGHRYAYDPDGERVIIGTYEIATTAKLPDGTTHVIDAQRLAMSHVGLQHDLMGDLASATYEHDLDLRHPDGTPVLGRAHHDHVAWSRNRQHYRP